MPEPQYVSTISASQALGVSVSTVKRWVDEGILPAHKTAGGHRKLLVSDLLRVARESGLPHVDLSQLVTERPAARSVAGLEQLASDLYHALRENDLTRARAIVLATVRQGTPIATLADAVIGPVMHRIGQDWETGRIGVMHEHRATQSITSILYELKATIEMSAVAHRPTAVGGAPERDESLLPTLLVQMVLLDLGWNAVNLGPNTPVGSFIQAFDEYEPRICWVSVCHLANPEQFVMDYRTLYVEAEKRGIAVAIGGYAFNESLRTRLPYTTYGDGLTQLAAFARTVSPRPKRPKRGRPKKN